MTDEDLKAMLLANPKCYRVLQIIRDLSLPDVWLAAGSVRNFIWNTLSEKPAFDDDTDLDVVFFAPHLSDTDTVQLEKQVKQDFPNFRWELKNQTDIHQHSPNTLLYTSTCDAISKYPERCTAIAVRLNQADELELFAPYGLADILDFCVRPTPHFLADAERMQVYHQRLAKKNWQEKWPQLQLLNR